VADRLRFVAAVVNARVFVCLNAANVNRFAWRYR